MTNPPLVTPDEVAFLEALYGDPLRSETTRAGRHLVVLSATSVAVVVLKGTLVPAGMLPVQFADGSGALAMVLAVAVVLLLVSFAGRALNDVLHAREASLLVTRYLEAERVAAAKKSAEATDIEVSYVDEGYSEPWWEAYAEVLTRADRTVEVARDRVGARRAARRLRALRLWLEIAVPILCGTLAVVVSASLLRDFALLVVSHLAG